MGKLLKRKTCDNARPFLIRLLNYTDLICSSTFCFLEKIVLYTKRDKNEICIKESEENIKSSENHKKPTIFLNIKLKAFDSVGLGLRRFKLLLLILLLKMKTIPQNQVLRNDF